MNVNISTALDNLQSELEASRRILVAAYPERRISDSPIILPVPRDEVPADHVGVVSVYQVWWAWAYPSASGTSTMHSWMWVDPYGQVVEQDEIMAEHFLD